MSFERVWGDTVAVATVLEVLGILEEFFLLQADLDILKLRLVNLAGFLEGLAPLSESEQFVLLLG